MSRYIGIDVEFDSTKRTLELSQRTLNEEVVADANVAAKHRSKPVN